MVPRKPDRLFPAGLPARAVLPAGIATDCHVCRTPRNCNQHVCRLIVAAVAERGHPRTEHARIPTVRAPVRCRQHHEYHDLPAVLPGGWRALHAARHAAQILEDIATFQRGGHRGRHPGDALR